MKKTRWINFLGGNNIIFTLVVFILLGVLLLIYNQLEFVFEPFVVIVSAIIMPFIISLLFYYLLNPVVDFLERYRIKRLWSVILLYVLAIVLLGVLVGTLIPLLRDQAESFIENFPEFFNNFLDMVTGWLEVLPFGAEVDDLIQQGQEFLLQLPENLGGYLDGSGFSGISSVVSSVTSVVVTIATFPIMLFFMLKDDKKFFNAALKIVPPTWRKDLIRVATQINLQVGAYVKGQLIIATSIAVMMFIGFTIIGIEYSGILAIAAGFLSIVPYIGPTISFVPPVVLALTDSWVTVVQLLIVWAIIQFIDGNLIEPNVMGRQLNVHPLTIIIVLLIIGDLMGIFGLIFGVPIYAIIKVIVVYVFSQFKKRYNIYYGDVAGEYSVEPIEVALSAKSVEEDPTLKANIEEARMNRKKAEEKIKSESKEHKGIKNIKEKIKHKIKNDDEEK